MADAVAASEWLRTRTRSSTPGPRHALMPRTPRTINVWDFHTRTPNSPHTNKKPTHPETLSAQPETHTHTARSHVGTPNTTTAWLPKITAGPLADNNLVCHHRQQCRYQSAGFLCGINQILSPTRGQRRFTHMTQQRNHRICDRTRLSFEL